MEEHIAVRSVRALADSIRAMSRRGGCEGVEEDVEGFGSHGCRSGRVCRITSVMKCRSDEELTLGTTRASRLGALSCTISSQPFGHSWPMIKKTYHFGQIVQCQPTLDTVNSHSRLSYSLRSILLQEVTQLFPCVGFARWCDGVFKVVGDVVDRGNCAGLIEELARRRWHCYWSVS